MFDKRVVRGSTYAPKRALAETLPQQQAPIARTQAHNVIAVHDELRPPTPAPVAGRHHMSVQTDNYLEDLRERNNTVELATQTNPELDIPTVPLFEPISSGVDMYTWIEAGDMFDFDLEVEPILGVITSKSLNNALLQVRLTPFATHDLVACMF